jgi:hypothetical protein
MLIFVDKILLFIIFSVVVSTSPVRYFFSSRWAYQKMYKYDKL